MNTHQVNDGQIVVGLYEGFDAACAAAAHYEVAKRETTRDPIKALQIIRIDD